MKNIAKLSLGVLSLILCCSSSIVFAEEAPVIDRSNTFINAESNSNENNYYVENDEDLQPKSVADKPISSRHSRSHGNAVLLTQIEALRQEISELRGQLEVQTHDLKLLKEEQLAYYKDLDSRLIAKKGEEKAFASNQPRETKFSSYKQKVLPKMEQNKPDEQLSYAFAYEQIQSKHFDKALSAMNDYIKNFPNGAYTANAYYWQGELLVKQDQLNKAIDSFSAVIEEFPESTKVAPAMYKLATTHALLGDVKKADQTLKQVINQFPDTATARLAESKLINLKATT